jgi:hypothetical protein
MPANTNNSRAKRGHEQPVLALSLPISHGQTEPDATLTHGSNLLREDWDVSSEIERLIVAKTDATSENAVQRRLALNANQGSLQCFSECCQQPRGAIAEPTHLMETEGVRGLTEFPAGEQKVGTAQVFSRYSRHK